MSLAAVGIDWVTPEEATWLVHLCWLAVVIVVAGWRTETPSWKTRAKTAERENTALRLQLAAPRNQPGARPRPRELHEWPEPTTPARERHWTSTLWWPGCRGSALPLEYGTTPLDGSRLDDPCLTPPAPDGAELREWILVERLFDTLTGDPGWSAEALPPPVHPRSLFAAPRPAPALTITQELEALCG